MKVTKRSNRRKRLVRTYDAPLFPLGNFQSSYIRTERSNRIIAARAKYACISDFFLRCPIVTRQLVFLLQHRLRYIDVRKKKREKKKRGNRQYLWTNKRFLNFSNFYIKIIFSVRFAFAYRSCIGDGDTKKKRT